MTRAAMDSTTAGSGDELVATLEARELWMDVNLQTLVAPLVRTISMPSNPFEMPRQLGDVNFYPGSENAAATGTALGTGKTTLTAHELVGQVPYSFTLEEDAVIAMLPEIRAGLVRNVAETLDDVILNADMTTTNNINADGATIAAADAGKGHWLIGLRRAAAPSAGRQTRRRRTTTGPRCRTTCSTRCGRSWASTGRVRRS